MSAESDHPPGLLAGLGVVTVILAGCAGSGDIESGATAITLCHDERRTLVLTEEQAQEHLDHGDVVGECGGR